MKNYNYTARDKNGALVRDSIKASDRKDVLSAISERGLSPVSVVEGTAVKTPRVIRSAIMGWSASLTVALLIFGGFVLLRSSKKTIDTTNRAETKVEKQALPPKRIETAINERVDPPENIVEMKPIVEATVQEVTPTVQENSVILTAKQKNVMLTPQKKRRVIETVDGMSTNQPPTGYSSGSERLLNMIMNAQVGNAPPPLLNLPPGEKIEEILNRDIMVFDTDDEKTIAEKTAVAYAKQLLKEYINEGGAPEQFLQHYHDELTAAFQERQAAQAQVTELLRNGDEEGAFRQMEENNKILIMKGIKPIKMPRLSK